MRKRVIVLALAGLFAFGGTAVAADYERVAGTNTTTSDEDDGTDYGWIGLLGLAGLAGLLGRKRDDHHRDTSRGSSTTGTH